MHGDYSGIHGRDRNASTVREGMGDPTIRCHVGHPGDTVSRIVLYADKNP